MKAKIVWGVILTIAAALLVVGAVNRTMARSDTSSANSDQANTQQGRGRLANEELEGSSTGPRNGQNNTEHEGVASENLGQGNGGQGNGGQGNGRSEANAREPLAEVDNLETLQATVIGMNEEKLMLEQEDGNQFEIGGRGWGFALDNGFAANVGDTIIVTGFYEGDHFEPVSLANNGSNQQVQLREASGSPLWLGQGGSGQSSGGQGKNRAEADVREPLAEADNLETLHGTVVEVNGEQLMLEQGDGSQFEIGGRAWGFALENGFTVGQDDTITVVGFYDEDHFEPIAMTNDGSGQQIQLREATGRPLWAGRGQRNAGT